MRNASDKGALKKYCLQQGADIFGVADVTGIRASFTLAPRLLGMISRAVCLGVGLNRGVLDDVDRAPTRLYFHHYKTVNAFLDQLALRVARFIEKKGYSAVPIPASQIVDWQKQTAHLSHKQVGYLAGTGWIGRNNLLVNEAFGSQFRLATVLTDMPLRADKPLSRSCGACRMCIEACPCGAIKTSPQEFDHQGCFSQLKEFQKARLVDQYICGVCVHVCRGKRA